MALLIFAFSIFFSTTYAPADVSNVDYSGTWEYRIDFPEGAWVGAIILEKQDEGYTGYIVTSENFLGEEGLKFEITDLVVEGNRMTFKTAPFEYGVIVDGEFDDNVYKGKVVLDTWEIPFEAKRKI